MAVTGEQKRPQVPLVCHGHSRPIVDLSYSKVTDDGIFIISASKDGKPMLRSGENGDWIGTFEGHKGAVWGASLDAPALKAATASADFSASIWDAISGDMLHSFAHKHIVRSAHFSQDSQRLMTGGYEKILRIFDLSRLDADPTVVSTSSNIRNAIWQKEDSLAVVTFMELPGVQVFDLRSGQAIITLDTKSFCTSLEASEDGRYLTTADGDEVKFWDTNGFGLVKSFSIPNGAESASFSPHKRKFVAGGLDLWVRLFDSETGAELECNKGHHGPVHCTRFSPSGESYASGSEDGTIRIWKTSSENGEHVNVLKVGVEEVVTKVEGFHIG